MSDFRETSYYEIALTNRQVLTVFVILLACVVAAFLSGVWIGKRGEAVAVETVAAQTISSGVAGGEEPLDQLHFFSEAGATPQAPDAAGAPEPAGPPEPAAGGSGPEAAPPAAPREPARRQRTAEPSPEPAAESQPPAPRPSAPPPAPRREPAPAPETRSLVVIQVFSSSDREQAEKVVARLREGGLPALLAPVEVSGKTMYRVRVGPYRDRAEAQLVAGRVRKEFRLDTWIID